MRVVFSSNPFRFFAEDGYPFNLDHVERRDGVNRQLRLIMDIFDLSGARVLDAGCGNGRFAEPLHQAGATVIGVDLVQGLLRKAKARYTGITFIRADLRALPFQDNVFDYVVSLYSSMGYTAQRLAMELNELRRVCRPNGLLVLDLLNSGSQFRSFGLEKLPDGVGIWWKRRWKERILQWNLAVSRSVIGLFGLSYPFASLDSVTRDLVDSRWQPTDVFGDYDGNALRADSPRMIIVCSAI